MFDNCHLKTRPLPQCLSPAGYKEKLEVVKDQIQLLQNIRRA